LMEKVSEGALKAMADEFRIDELETQKTALEEKLKAVLEENRILNTQILVRGPKDRVTEQNIRVSGNNVVIYVGEGPVIGEIAGTGSMLPSLTAYSSVIELIPQKSEEIELGDIIAYKLNEETIIHRVIGIGTDEKGWYALTKGDNIPKPDTDKVRFEQIKRVVVGIIY
jgi:hydroxyethylthiazole kinase-like sugar kinase family protein